jgi:hypothetical protein
MARDILRWRYPAPVPELKSEGSNVMDLEWILQLVLFGILHWVLAVLLLQDIAGRDRVRGGRKAPWVLAIVLVTFLGSLLYMVFHPQVFIEDNDDDDRNR